MLYIILLFSAKHQHESAISILLFFYCTEICFPEIFSRFLISCYKEQKPLRNLYIYIYIFIYLFTYLAVPGLSCSMQTLSGSMWDLVPQPGIKPGAPCIGSEES